ncbi:aminotransferase class IV family protein [Pseudomonas chengduensis]|nr:aminotransferase class IV family protein [Pseudomonas chengduensis]MDH1730232.1 aminotransferase class IV family protein [Pseudomonas chengduensis]
MAIHPTPYPSYIDGQPVSASPLNPLAFAGFAHFTAMQVRHSRIKGLDLHLQRLRDASLKLFNRAPTEALLRSYIRTAVEEGASDQSLTVTVFSPHGEFTAASMEVEPAVFVRTAAPSNGPQGPLRLSVIEHERPLAAIKHVGEIGKTYYLHQAIREGFDDAAFVNRRGHLSEATIWNLAFWDGETVIWPEAEMLKGTMMGMVQRQLARLGVPQRCEVITLERVKELSGAAVMNSWTPGIPVTAIAAHTLDEARPFIELLHKAHEAEPADFP